MGKTGLRYVLFLHVPCSHTYSPTSAAFYLTIEPSWIDGLTMVRPLCPVWTMMTIQ